MHDSISLVFVSAKSSPQKLVFQLGGNPLSLLLSFAILGMGLGIVFMGVEASQNLFAIAFGGVISLVGLNTMLSLERTVITPDKVQYQKRGLTGFYSPRWTKDQIKGVKIELFRNSSSSGGTSHQDEFRVQLVARDFTTANLSKHVFSRGDDSAAKQSAEEEANRVAELLECSVEAAI